MSYFEGTNSKETIKGTAGADEIYGFDGKDNIKGLQGANTIFGGSGDDTIEAGKGRDLIYAEDGNDLIEVKGNHSGTYVVGGFGRDIISLDAADEGTFLSLDYDFQYDLNGSDPLDFIEVTVRNSSIEIEKTDSSSSVESDNVDGLRSLGDDGHVFLFGTAGDDRVEVDRSSGPWLTFFADGNDTVNGDEDTYETITFGPSYRYDSDSSSGFGDYNQIIITSSSNGQMSGRVEQSRANAADESTDSYTIRFTGMDMIEGSVGDDLATGSSGDDKFRPGQGNDGFDGKNGTDTVYYDSDGITKTVVDLQYGFGEAWYSHDSLSHPVPGYYRDSYSGAAGADGDSDYFEFSEQSHYDGLVKVENVVGGSGKDIIRGDDKGNVLEGGGNDDILNGRQGNDTIIGGDGDDRLRGFAGKDKFEFDSADGSDRIAKFGDGEDKIRVGDGLKYKDVDITDQGRHTNVSFGDTEVILLNFDHSLLDKADFGFF